MKNILVAIDFEPQAARLLTQAQLLARPFGAKVWIVHVAAPDPDFVGFDAGPQTVRDQRAEELQQERQQLQAWAEQIKAAGLHAEPLLIQGPTVNTLLQESERLQADMIIIGAEDHGWIYEALFGSTTDSVMQGAKVPVLAVPLRKE